MHTRCIVKARVSVILLPFVNLKGSCTGIPLSRNVLVTPTPAFFQKYCRTNGGRTAVQMGGGGQAGSPGAPFSWDLEIETTPFLSLES